MLAINLVGFGPTLYLRPFFDVPPIPLYLYIHGILGTAWFALLLAQAILIRNRNFVQHRQLGWATITVAAAVLVFGIYTSTNLVPRNLALGEISPAELALFSAVTAADTASFIYFPALIAASQAHGRAHATIVGIVMVLGLSLGFRLGGLGAAVVAARLGG